MASRVKDTGSMEDIVSELKKLNQMSVVVGVMGSEESEIQIIAGTHEFGATINRINEKTGETSIIEIPERSYIRATLDKKSVQDGIFKIVKLGVDGIVARTLSAIQVANQVGLYVVGEIKNRIVSSDPEFAPLSESYSKRKKGPGILRESLKLFNAISYKVVQA